MTPDQFEALADITKTTGARRIAARLVLVEGVRPIEAARQTGLLRQRVYDATRRIQRADAIIRPAFERF